MRVACLDLAALRDYLSGQEGSIEAMMHSAAEADRQLYSLAVQQQVRARGQGPADEAM